MNEEEKKAYLEEYSEAKKKGLPFFPDILFKDAIAALVVFLILAALAYFVGSPLDERADPADASFTPRPEWYFLFLFQLLKYFPGELEVIGVVVIPTLAIILLFLLPLLDRSSKRHFLSRPLVTLVTVVGIVGVVLLTVQSVREAPPPIEASAGDPTAALYAKNCAGCHGDEILVPTGTNLHDIIAQGSHEGMPAWSADLTADEIDALAGFVLSPAGSELFAENCGPCHEATELVEADPLALREALDQSSSYASHVDLEIPEWGEAFTKSERSALLNFLAAPDGQRLFAVNCSSCHGRSIAFVGDEEELRSLISEGGLHLEMPPWQEKLSDSEIDRLALYVLDPASAPNNKELFDRHCTNCHGERVPASDNFVEAREIIATGGSHKTMPVWGNALTNEQLTALVDYTMSAATGTPLEAGQQLYTDNCASCHGDFGEGGENPARPNDIIAPISTAEYLRTRDDATLRNIIAQGQPNFGMSPFGSAFGGPLDDDEIDSLVAFIRSWQADPPVELPPDIPAETVSLDGFDLYVDVCAQCHGIGGEGVTAPSFRRPDFRSSNTTEDIFNTINEGHGATNMIAWGAILNSEQIQELVEYIELLPIDEPQPEAPSEGVEESSEPEAEATTEPEGEAEPTEEPELSFATSVFPILEARCVDCHPSDGGYDATTYDSVISSGDNGPAVIPGDVEGSLLAQKLIGSHEEGDIMPPPPIRPLNEDLVQIILDWIAAGAPE